MWPRWDLNLCIFTTNVIFFFLTKSTSYSPQANLFSIILANGHLCEFTVSWQIQVLVKSPQGWLISLQISSALGKSESLVQGAGCYGEELEPLTCVLETPAGLEAIL